MALKEKQLLASEVEQLKTLENVYNSLIFQAGQLTLTEMEIEEEREVVMEGFKELKNNEAKLRETLSKKYGSGEIDLEKGTIIVV